MQGRQEIDALLKKTLSLKTKDVKKKIKDGKT